MNNISNNPKALKITKLTLISVLLIFCGSLCFVSGCFLPNNNIDKNANYSKSQNIRKFKYKNFVNAWNKALLDNQHFIEFNINKLLLPTTSDKDVIKKLNQIFDPIRIKIQIEKYRNKLTQNKLLDIPIYEYIIFLQNLNFKEEKFNKRLSIEEIEKLILYMMNSDYKHLTSSTIQQLIWTYSFKNYFKDNIEIFIKKGFSRNLKNYEKYESIIDSNSSF